jgi:hypothetical protein
MAGIASLHETRARGSERFHRERSTARRAAPGASAQQQGQVKQCLRQRGDRARRPGELEM